MLISLEIPITIYTHNHKLISDLLEETSVKLGMEKKVADGLALRYDNAKIRKAFGFPEMIQITLLVAATLSEEVAADLITAWLLKKLDKKEAEVKSPQIDRLTVELDKDKIKKIVLEKIKKTT